MEGLQFPGTIEFTELELSNIINFHTPEQVDVNMEQSTFEELQVQLTSLDQQSPLPPNVQIQTNISNVEIESNSTQISEITKKKERKKRQPNGEKKTRFNCKTCNVSFTAHSSLMRHELVHSENTCPYVCDICDKRFTQKSTLATHKNNIHETTKVYPCLHCDKTFLKSWLRLEHRKREHSEVIGPQPEFRCSKCDRTFIRQRNLDIHEKLKCDRKQDPTEILDVEKFQKDGTVQCTICKKNLAHQKQLKMHYLVHLGSRNFLCHMCPRTFTWKRGLQEHTSRDHLGEKRFKSKYCDRPFKWKHEQKAHDKIHAEKDICVQSISRKLFPCKLCPQEFHNKLLLTTHVEQTHLKSLTIRAQKMVIKPLRDVDISLIQVNSSSDTLWHLCLKCGRAITDMLGAKNHQLVCQAGIVVREESLEEDDFQNQNNQISFDDMGENCANLSEISEENFTNNDNPNESSDTREYYFNGSSLGENEHTWNDSTKFEFSMPCVLSLREKKHVQNVTVNILRMAVKPLVGDDAGISLIQTDRYTKELWHACAKCGRANMEIKDARIHQLVCVKEESIENNTVLNPVLTQIKLEDDVEDWNDSLLTDPLEIDPFETGLFDTDTTVIDTLKKNCSESVILKRDCNEIAKADKIKPKYKKTTTNHNSKTGSRIRKKSSHCKICSKSFTDITLLRRHEAIHEEKRFVCDFCDKKFRTQEYLTIHLRSHTGEKPFQCDNCEKSFADKRFLNEHVKIYHTGNFACDVCGTKFLSEELLTNHLRTHSANTKNVTTYDWEEKYLQVIVSDNPFQCKSCLRSFPLKKILKCHVKMHEKNVACHTCGEKFRNNHYLTIHIRSHTGEQPFQCKNCSKSFRQLKTLRTHERDHCHEGKSFACVVCEKIFPTPATLTNHYREHPNEQPFHCKICSKSFRKKKALRSHEQIHEEKHFVCDLCDKKFSTKKYLIVHLKCHTEERPFQCDDCEKPFGDRIFLQEHVEIYHTGNFACDVCGIQFLTDELRTNHLKTHSAETLFQCKICSKTFTQHRTLGIHERDHCHEGKSFACVVCGKIFSTPTSLTNHYREHPNEQPFHCKICSKSFRKKKALRNHEAIHEEKRYVCDFCNKKLRTQKDLTIHLRSHTGERPFQCDNCEKSFADKKLLQEHVRIYHTGNFACDVCGRKFFSKELLTNHLKTHSAETKVTTYGWEAKYLQIIVSDNPFQCKSCLKSFPLKTILRRHVNIHENNLICYACGKECRNKVELASHIRSHTGERPFQCKTCSKSFITIGAIRTHENFHCNEGKSFVCDVCGKILPNPISLTVHYRRHPEKQPYQCKTCSKSFRTNESLTRHENTHEGVRTMVKNFICDVCGKLFVSQKSLIIHHKSHTGEGLFQCKTCLKSFLRKSALVLHENVHREKTFFCDLCDKKFTQKIYLKTHRFIHTGEKPYKCNLCNYAARQAIRLVFHSRIHTGEKPFKCDICNYATTQPNQLKLHKNTHLSKEERMLRARAPISKIKHCICKFCGKLFNYSQTCRIHELTQHGKSKPMPYTCKICSKSFTYKSNATSHVKGIHHEKLFGPNECSTGANPKDFILTDASLLPNKPK